MGKHYIYIYDKPLDLFFPINDHRHTCACPGLNIVLAVVQLKRAIALPDILVSRRICYWKMGKSEDMRNRGNKKELLPQSKTMKFLSAQSVINLHEDHLIWFHHRQSWCPACATPCPWTQPESLKWCWGWTSWQIRHGRHGKWLKYAKIQYKPSRQLVQRIRIFLQVILRFRTEAGGHKNVTMLVSGAFWLLEMLSFMPGIRWSPLESSWDPGRRDQLNVGRGTVAPHTPHTRPCTRADARCLHIQPPNPLPAVPSGQAALILWSQVHLIHLPGLCSDGCHNRGAINPHEANVLSGLDLSRSGCMATLQFVVKFASANTKLDWKPHVIWKNMWFFRLLLWRICCQTVSQALVDLRLKISPLSASDSPVFKWVQGVPVKSNGWLWFSIEIAI